MEHPEHVVQLLGLGLLAWPGENPDRNTGSRGAHILVGGRALRSRGLGAGAACPGSPSLWRVWVLPPETDLPGLW